MPSIRSKRVAVQREVNAAHTHTHTLTSLEMGQIRISTEDKGCGLADATNSWWWWRCVRVLINCTNASGSSQNEREARIHNTGLFIEDEPVFIQLWGEPLRLYLVVVELKVKCEVNFGHHLPVCQLSTVPLPHEPAIERVRCFEYFSVALCCLFPRDRIRILDYRILSVPHFGYFSFLLSIAESTLNLI